MKMVNTIASALSPEGYDLESERREHVWQVHLLGDPMLRMQYPKQMNVQVPERAAPGDILRVTGDIAADSQLTVELAFRRPDVPRSVSAQAVTVDTEDGRSNYQDRYRLANEKVIIEDTSRCQAGAFESAIEIPSDLRRGRYCVRVYAEGQSGWEVGYQELLIRPEKKENSPR